MWGCKGPSPANVGKTSIRPAVKQSEPPASVVARRPMLAANPDEDVFADWLGHVQAGRIEVR